MVRYLKQKCERGKDRVWLDEIYHTVPESLIHTHYVPFTIRKSEKTQQSDWLREKGGAYKRYEGNIMGVVMRELAKH